MQENQKSVRVRFAPSPTGYLHIGGARTALFNWLFARASGGKFILRIEDTDKIRSTQEDVTRILESLKWLGLNWDEGPFFQSERKGIYREYAQKLLDAGLAYYSDEQRGEYKAVIFKIPHKKVVVKDIVHGDMEFDNSLIKDLVIFKSDGYPTYNFACVIDDALMGLTHIIRGDDHIPNTPKQIALYEALGFPVPCFAHVPLILGKDKSRLSKRHGATSVQSYQEDGYLPDAMVNFLSLLGWSPGDNREIMGLDELIKSFSLDRINSNNSVFDDEKLRWMNGNYIKKLPFDEYKAKTMPFLKEKISNLNTTDVDVDYILKIMHERLRVLKDIVPQTDYFFNDDFQYDPKAVKKRLLKPNADKILTTLSDKLEKLDIFNEQTTEVATRSILDELGVSAGAIIHPARVALTGLTAGPGLFEIMAVLGKTKTVSRIHRAVKFIKSQGVAEC
ncbi:glutamate--tRNA ligase [bacterium]|nr:glutamate--tRNA ligase [bacterium]